MGERRFSWKVARADASGFVVEGPKGESRTLKWGDVESALRRRTKDWGAYEVRIWSRAGGGLKRGIVLSDADGARLESAAPESLRPFVLDATGEIRLEHSIHDYVWVEAATGAGDGSALEDDDGEEDPDSDEDNEGNDLASRWVRVERPVDRAAILRVIEAKILALGARIKARKPGEHVRFVHGSLRVTQNLEERRMLIEAAVLPEGVGAKIRLTMALPLGAFHELEAVGTLSRIGPGWLEWISPAWLAVAKDDTLFFTSPWFQTERRGALGTLNRLAHDPQSKGERAALHLVIMVISHGLVLGLSGVFLQAMRWAPGGTPVIALFLAFGFLIGFIVSWAIIRLDAMWRLRRALGLGGRAALTGRASTWWHLETRSASHRNAFRNDEAVAAGRLAVAAGARLFGQDSWEHTDSLNTLARALKQKRSFREAETLYRRAIDISFRSQPKPDSYHATLLNNLAELCREEQKFGEAEPLYLRALEIQRRALGESHKETLRIWYNLGNLCYATGRAEMGRRMQEPWNEMVRQERSGR